MTRVETNTIFKTYDSNDTILVTKLVKFMMDEWNVFNQTSFNNSFSTDAKIQELNISDIINCQRFVLAEILKEKENNYTSKESSIQIFKYEGRFLLNNGYHRVAAMILAGETKITAEVVDLDKINTEDLQWI